MKSLLLLFFTFLLSFAVMGQKLYVDIETTKPSPGVGEKFKISYILKLKMNGGVASISHNGIRLKKPNFDPGFTIIQEGNEATSFGFGNRDMEISKYSFIVQAKKKGTFEIAPLSFFMNGEEVVSGVFTINVETGAPNVKIEAADPNLFAKIETNKRTVFKGESVILTYKIYTRYTGFAIEDYDMPMTNGLWKEEIKPTGNGWKQTTETVNGVGYYVLTLKKEIVVPQKTGDIKIEPIEIKALIGRSFFSQGEQKTFSSNAPTITVKSLPTPAPPSFSDQVGSNYKLDLTYSTNQLKTNEPLDVNLTISGNGNINQLSFPKLDFPIDFEVFDPELNDQVKISSNGIVGKRTFNYLVIPRHRGVYELPVFDFTYFDINSKKYVTLTSPAQTITVEKGENELETTGSDIAEQQRVEILNTGIRHIKEDTVLHAKKDAIYNTTLFWTLILLPFVIALILYIYIVLRRNTANDETLNMQKNANKTATNKLKKASVLLSENKHLEFYEELNKAISDYCSHKLSIPTASLTKTNIAKALQEKAVNNTTIQLVIETLNECEMARFSPVRHADAENTLTNATNIINQIERDVKK